MILYIHDLVKDNVGLTYEFDEEELANCFEKLLNDEQLCKQFGKTGRKLIETKYEWNKIEKEIYNIYLACLD